MEDKTLISIQISKQEKSLFEGYVKSLKLNSLSDFLREAARMFGHLGSFLSGKLDSFSKNLGRSRAEVIRVAVLCYLADLEVESELAETRLLDEFANTPAGFRSSEDIFEKRKEYTRRKIWTQRESERRLRKLLSKP